jgi:hypothetical protein
MSDPTAGAAGDALQFDTAEHTTPEVAMSCAACTRPIQSVYHQAAGKTVCSSCRARLEAVGGGNFGKAILFGSVAGAAGWAIYFAILKITNYEIGIIAVLVGYMVGRAVNVGSGGRGGRSYQILAAMLTYVAITATYVPLIMASAAEGGGGIGLVAAVIFALMYPFLAITSSPFGIVILGVGLWQAWIGNRRLELQFTGPHPLAAPAEPALA